MSDVTMTNKRRYKRFSVDLVSIGGRMVRATEVTLLDISADELSLRADMRLNMGSSYVLKVHDANGNIALKGTVLWSSLTETRQGPDGDVIPQYKAVLKLANASPQMLSKLSLQIAAQKQEDEGMRRASAADIAGAEGVFLAFPEGYQVRKISLGGMLIEKTGKVDIDRKIPMEISLPGGTSIQFQGRIASCMPSPEKGPDIFEIGIEFLDMPEEDKRGLSSFIDSLGSD